MILGAASTRLSASLSSSTLSILSFLVSFSSSSSESSSLSASECSLFSELDGPDPMIEATNASALKRNHFLQISIGVFANLQKK